jgi:hypothetical protein
LTKNKRDYLNATDIRRGTERGLRKYEGLNFFEQFAMYIGVAQLLEISLKQILERKYGYDIDSIEKWTLGRVASELKKKGLREDFFQLLDPVVVDRNYIAHNLLASDILFNSFTKSKNIYTKERRRLARAIYELEQIFFLLTWSNKYKAWS